jgi:hypothetical protein
MESLLRRDMSIALKNVLHVRRVRTSASAAIRNRFALRQGTASVIPSAQGKSPASWWGGGARGDRFCRSDEISKTKKSRHSCNGVIVRGQTTSAERIRLGIAHVLVCCMHIKINILVDARNTLVASLHLLHTPLTA